jgi:Sigma-54 interaction domain
MAALQSYYWNPIKMRLSDTMAVLATSCQSAHRILCTNFPVLSASYSPFPARLRFPAEFTQGSGRRTVHKSGENELFGREKGAYTGALTKQMGRVELADNSTLFLDEIGELSLELQAKLLRVVRDGEFERLGGPKTIKVNV